MCTPIIIKGVSSYNSWKNITSSEHYSKDQHTQSAILFFVVYSVNKFSLMLLCFFERKHLNESKKKVSVSTCALPAEKKHLKKANKHFQSEKKYKNSISLF